jgi:acetoin:2,6-dichlorophenolindophenol oxidoreductase subunit beta
MTKVRMRQAVIRALADELESDPAVILLGEDIAAAGGAFKATEGLLERFGPGRVRDTPISEMAFLGAAVGAAMAGLRPVVEMMFVEFTGVALDQLVTEAAKVSYLSRGTLTAPLTLRASAGAGLGFGCQHSQFLDNWFRATPGLKLVVPSGARTAYGLLRAAIRDPGPVVVLEPRVLYAEREDVEFGEAAILPLGRAHRLTRGDDVTLVALGATVRTAVAALEHAAGSWTADVIDLQTLVPWDRDTVVESVRRTGRLVIVEEAPYSGGWGSEICDHVAGELFGELKAPALRVTTPDVPVPYSRPLEERFVPTAELVANQVGELLATGRRPAPWWEMTSR